MQVASPQPDESRPLLTTNLGVRAYWHHKHPLFVGITAVAEFGADVVSNSRWIILPTLGTFRWFIQHLTPAHPD